MSNLWVSWNGFRRYYFGKKAVVPIPGIWPVKTVNLEGFKEMYPKITREVKLNMNDPWKHRSKEMHCETCMYFVFKEVEGKPKHMGRCRRHAPTMKGYPVVFGTDWCGDHKLDETKI